jgi:uncharacterized membrane protein
MDKAMNKWLKIGIVGLMMVGALGALASGVAFAQDDTPEASDTTTTPAKGKPPGNGCHWGRGGVGLEAAAEALGMTTEELSTQLWGGKTLADLAEEKGVDLADVKAAVEEARTEALRKAIEQAVENEKLPREHADWLLEGLDKGYWGVSGRCGFLGWGFGGLLDHPDATKTTPSDGE